MRNRRMLGVGASLLVAVLGTLMLMKYSQSSASNNSDSNRPEPQATVLFVGGDPVPKGTKADDLGNLVQVRTIPSRLRVNEAVSSTSELDGLVAIVDLVPGEQVVKSRFATPKEKDRGTLRPDQLKVAIQLTPDRALVPLVQVGDTVAVIANFPKDDPFPAQAGVVLHKIEVLDLRGENVKPKDGSKPEETTGGLPDGAVMVTLAVTAEQAEVLQYAIENGVVRLGLETSDAPEGETPTRTRENVLQAVA